MPEPPARIIPFIGALYYSFGEFVCLVVDVIV